MDRSPVLPTPADQPNGNEPELSGARRGFRVTFAGIDLGKVDGFELHIPGEPVFRRSGRLVDSLTAPAAARP